MIEPINSIRPYNTPCASMGKLTATPVRKYIITMPVMIGMATMYSMTLETVNATENNTIANSAI